MEPGHYPAITNAEYHGGPGISKSHLDVIARGDRLYWQAYRNPSRPAREEKDAWTLGSATHCAILEPENFSKEFIVAPEPSEDDDIPKRPTKPQLNAAKKTDLAKRSIDFWAEFDARVKGRMVLSQEHYDLAWTMRDTVATHPKAGPLLKRLQANKGAAEQAYYAVDPETGLLLKCKFDYKDASPEALDVKTTRDANPVDFAKHVGDYRYHVQEAFYRKVFKLATGEELGPWTFLAIESTAPHQIGLYDLPRDIVRAAGRVAQENLRRIADGIAMDYWPDPGYSGVITLDLPRWEKKKLGIDSAENDFDGLDA